MQPPPGPHDPVAREENGMILRLVRGRVPHDALVPLRESFDTAYVPTARRTPGLARFHVGIRQEGPGAWEILSLTCWTSADAALQAYGGDLMAPRTLAGLEPHIEVREVLFFELDETILRRPSSAPGLLRLTIGRTGAGHDVELQQDLRRRVPALGEAMREAYVARRMLGGMVEVALVSCWDHDARLALDEPFWPEIADRYEAFEVRVFQTLASGGTASPGQEGA